jgi:hypothetical protein
MTSPPITDEMIAAGRHAWDCNMGGDPKAVLRAIYLAMRSSAPPVMGMEEMVERASEAYADATDYYVKFHRGLSSPSADRIRKGIRAALEASGLLSTLAEK